MGFIDFAIKRWQITLVAFALLLAIGLSAFFTIPRSVDPHFPSPFVNVVAIVLVIMVLAVRRTIYFSPRLIHDEDNLADLLRRWRTIDIVLLSFSELIALFGLVITLLGMPFVRTFHYFVAAFLLTMILMPIQWKVKDKIRNFEKYSGKQME